MFFLLTLLSIFGFCRAEKKIYVFTDFAGEAHYGNQLIGDWQTAIELATGGWKLTQHPYIFMSDRATPLNPVKAGAQLETAFPYLGKHTLKSIDQIVVHVIDPGVGNTSHHPRALVLRKDGTLFIGPDNGTLSSACPPGSIAAIWEINTKYLSKLTGIDLEAGGTFHGRDVFVAAAYLIAANRVQPQDIGQAYQQPELKFRTESSSDDASKVQFQQVPTSRWNITLDHTAPNDALFTQAYFLAIVQSPVYTQGISPPLFTLETGNKNNQIAILNRKTGNLYVGPNNGVGTSFFQGFSSKDILIVQLEAAVYQQIRDCQDVHRALNLILKQNTLQQEALVTIDLLAHQLEPLDNSKRIIKGQIWVDAYGNIKTTLDTELFKKLQREGYTDITVELNGVTRPVQFASSFADVPPGKAWQFRVCRS